MSKYPNPVQYDKAMPVREAYRNAGILMPAGWRMAADGYAFECDHEPTPAELLAFRAWIRDAMPRVYATLNPGIRFTEPNGSWTLCRIAKVRRR